MAMPSSDKYPSAKDKMLEALEVTLGNIMSLGPAKALESVPMPYMVWARVVKEAIDAARAEIESK